MSLFGKGSSHGILASLFGRSGLRREQTAVDTALPEPLLPWQPSLPEPEPAATAVSLYHLDQNIGFDNAGMGVEIDDQATNDLFESICDSESRSVLQDAQSIWQSLYSAHGTPAAPGESQDVQVEGLEDADTDQTPDNGDCDSTRGAMDILVEMAEAAHTADAPPPETVAEADADEVRTALFEALAGHDEIDAAPVETEAGAAEADPENNEMETTAEGAGTAPTEQVPTPESVMSAAEGVDIVKVADFDPERDIIGVFYAKTIDAVTGKPVAPKVRISDNADGSGHIISLDGCAVARVIGAKHLAEDQIELIGE